MRWFDQPPVNGSDHDAHGGLDYDADEVLDDEERYDAQSARSPPLPCSVAVSLEVACGRRRRGAPRQPYVVVATLGVPRDVSWVLFEEQDVHRGRDVLCPMWRWGASDVAPVVGRSHN